MGLGGISIWQLLIVLAIVVLLFGTKKLRNIGGDLGSAVKSFKSAVKDGNEDALKPDEPEALDDDNAEGVAEFSEEKKSADSDKSA